MKIIYRYEIRANRESIVALPKGGQILSVACWKQGLCFWALVDTDQPNEDRHILAIGTGLPFPDSENLKADFIGMCMVDVYQEIYNVFELTQISA